MNPLLILTFIILCFFPSCRESSYRVLNYNICEGMNMDRESDYQNFIGWVKSKDPDLFCIEEANEIELAQLESMAAQWGHPYVVTNFGHVTSHNPVALTSRYKFKEVNRITQSDGVYHGGIHAKVNDIDVVVLHLYPFRDIRPEVSWDDRKDLDGDGDIDGDDYRVKEIEIYLEKTVRFYPERKNWLIMGDFNSVSPLDSTAYNKEYSFGTHQHLLKEFKDLLRMSHKNYQRSVPTGIFSTEKNDTGRRIDFIYGSESFADKMTETNLIIDKFTDRNSDHYPILSIFEP